MTDPASSASPGPAPGVAVTPVPSDDEAAAIAAALTLLWSGGGDEAATRPADPRWRFSGRWWSRPVPMSRPRPWRG